MTGPGQGIDGERIEQALAQVLEREHLPEMPAEPGGVEWFLHGMFDDVTLDTSISPRLALGLALVVALVLIVVWLRSRPACSRSVTDHGVASGSRAARALELLAAARAARAAGDHELAARLYLFALVVRHGERGDLEFRAAWTDRELLERGRPSAEVRERLGALLDELEPRTFGSEPVRAEDVERLASAYSELAGGTG